MSVKPSKDIETWNEEEEIRENGEIEEKKKALKKLELEKKRLEMEAEVERKKAELEKLKESTVKPSREEEVGGEETKTAAAAKIIAEMAKQGVPPEKASEYIDKLPPETLAKLYTLMDKNLILPTVLFRMQSPPSQLTAKDVVDINNAIIETAQRLSGGGGGESVKEIIEAIASIFSKSYEPISESLKTLRDELKETLAKREDALVTILKDNTLFERFSRLASPQPQPSMPGETAVKLKELDLNIEKMKQETMIRLEQMRQEHERALKLLDMKIAEINAEVASKRERDRILSDALKRIGYAVAEGLEEEGREETIPTPVKTPCPECGGEILIPPGASTVTCPKCSKQFNVQRT